MKLNVFHSNNKTGAIDEHQYTIQIRHLRPYTTKTINGERVRMPKTKGGATILAAISNKSPMPRIYEASCSQEDHFCRRTGLLIASQKLVWELIDKNSILDKYQFINGGTTLEFYCSAASSYYNSPKEEFFDMLYKGVYRPYKHDALDNGELPF